MPRSFGCYCASPWFRNAVSFALLLEQRGMLLWRRRGIRQWQDELVAARHEDRLHIGCELDDVLILQQLWRDGLREQRVGLRLRLRLDHTRIGSTLGRDDRRIGLA